MAIMTLAGVDAVVQRHHHPDRISHAQLLHTLRDALRAPPSPQPITGRALKWKMGHCTKDDYTRRRPKGSRHCATTTNTPTMRLQPPTVRPATPKEKNDALKYAEKAA